MKVAVLLCGLIPNNFNKYYDSIYKTMIEPFNSDIFISTWKSPLVDDIFALYKPKLCRIEDLNDISIKSRQNDSLKFVIEIGNDGNRMISTNGRYPMFYKIYDVNCLRKEYEMYKNIKYDLIIRGRFDLSFSHKHHDITRPPFLFDKTSEKEIEDCLKNDVLYLRKDTDTEAVPDQFAFGNDKVMNIYCDTFLNLERLLKPYYLNSESVLYWQLKNNEVDIRCTETVYDIKIYDR